MGWFAPISGTIAIQTAFAGDGLFIGPAVTLSVSGSWAVYFQSSEHVADIHGTVVSNAASAIRLGTDATAKGHTIEVHAGAVIRGYGSLGFDIEGYGTQFSNAGDIYGKFAGIDFLSWNSAYASTLTNSGKVSGGLYGVTHAAIGPLNVMNSGLIKADAAAFNSSGSGIANITNTGTIVGDVRLDDGNDVYSGASGRLSGRVYAGDGDDTAIGGIDNDWFDGGNGNDVLLGGGGNDTINGGAGSDILSGEAGSDALYGGTEDDNLQGGNGADLLAGESGNDLLYGGNDGDTLLGADGADRLYGGLGKDVLAGGAGKDVFVFNTKLNKSTNVDRLTDFSHVDDTIWLSSSIFKGMGKSILKSKFFYKGARAHDADDRIVYDVKKGALYYDPDGTGVKAQIKIAILASKPANLAYNDFLLI